MQESNPLHRLGLAASLRRRTYRFLSVGLVPVGWWSPIVTTGTAVTARAFCTRRTVMSSGGLHPRSGSGTPMLGRSRCGVAMTRRAAVFPRQGDADQFFDVTQIAHFLGARDQRDRDAVGAGTRGAADAMDVGFGNVG